MANKKARTTRGLGANISESFIWLTVTKPELAVPATVASVLLSRFIVGHFLSLVGLMAWPTSGLFSEVVHHSSVC